MWSFEGIIDESIKILEKINMQKKLIQNPSHPPPQVFQHPFSEFIIFTLSLSPPNVTFDTEKNCNFNLMIFN